MRFCEIFRELRKENGLTAKKVAENVNCSTNLIYDWEHGRCEPSFSTLIKLAELFGVSTDYLLGIKNEYFASKKSVSELTEKERKLLKTFVILSDNAQEKLISDAEFYAKEK